jgi:hypothetical protein
MYMVLEMCHEHEYHFSNKFALRFYAHAVHIGRIRKNTYKEVKLLNIANKDKTAPIFNMNIVWVYVEEGKSLGLKIWSFFENFTVSSASALTEEGLLSAKVFLPPWVFIRREPWMPASRRIWRTETAVSATEVVPSAEPFAESGSQNALGEGALHRERDLVLSAKRVVAESWTFGSRANPRSRWILCFVSGSGETLGTQQDAIHPMSRKTTTRRAETSGLHMQPIFFPVFESDGR